MKKFLAFILAMTTAAAVSVTAFAEPDDADDNNSAPVISLGADGDTDIASGKALLTPGKEYNFPVLLTKDGAAESISEDDLDNYRVKVTAETGKSAMDTAKFQKVDGEYVLTLKVKAGWPTEQTKVEYRVSLQDKSSYKEASAASAKFLAGYAVLADSAFADVADGEYVEVDPSAPVITEKQFEKMDELSGGKAVTFFHNSWKYSVRVTGLESRNLLSNENAVKEIVSKFEDQEFKFVSFPGGPTFDFTGELEIDVADVSEDFDGDYYVYRYLNGKLSLLSSSYDEDEDTLTLKTNKLGRFVITNKEIKDGTVVVEMNTGSDTDGDKTNPDTGASDFTALAVALGAVSLAAFGFLARKK
ncbi:MAG: hypothetical protein MR014_08855 [Oscillospiraceae bacterium]|nr:hypothetical protein [Oscillospiraceae bacterium]